MPYADLPTGARLHYDEENANAAGTPVLLLHGMLGIPREQIGNVIEWLATAGYRVIAPTLRGYGDSTPKPRDFPPRFYHRDAADVLAFMDVLQLQRAHLVGYSDGGEISLLCGTLQAQRFASICAWGAVGYAGAELRPRVQQNIPGSAWLTPEELAPHGMSDPDAFALGWVRGFTHYIDMGGDISLAGADKVACSALILLGDKDTLNPQRYAEQWVQRAPQGHLQMFDSGHAIHDQQPEAFRAALLAHLKGAEV